MKLHRIQGIVLRFLFVMKHSLNRWSDALYWPTVDLILWGLTITYVQSLSSEPTKLILSVITGLLLWTFVWRGQYEISVNILEDLWSKNFINFFVSPISFAEFIISFFILGFIKAFIGFLFTACIAFILYQTNIFTLGFYLIPFILLLFMTGWWVGLLVGGLILQYGTKVEQFAWSFLYVLSPFSGIYYPISTLPVWAQKIALFVPTSYIFEGARKIIQNGKLDPQKLIICFLLNCVYLALSVLFIRMSFKKLLQKGLVKVY